MANAHSFPLLRLPNLAREQVIKLMHVSDQYLLSKISKKSMKITKTSISCVPYTLTVTFKYPRCHLEIKKTESEETLKIPIKPLCSLTKQLESSHGLFNFSTSNFQFYGVSHKTIQKVMESVRSLNMEIYELLVDSKGVVDNEMFGYIMDNFRDVKKLENRCKANPNFLWNPQQPYTFDHCLLVSSQWLTVDNLTRMFKDCRYFTTMDFPHLLRFNEDFNQLMKWWINDSTMEYISVGVNFLELPDAMEGIEKESVKSAFIDNVFHEFSEEYGFKIRQKCGREAIVCMVEYVQWYKFILATNFDRVNEDEFGWESDEEEDEEEMDDKKILKKRKAVMTRGKK
ncbi:unnamed protein product [Caenorhabditis brenneri]